MQVNLALVNLLFAAGKLFSADNFYLVFFSTCDALYSLSMMTLCGKSEHSE